MDLDLRIVNVFVGPRTSGNTALAKLLTILQAPGQFWRPDDPGKTDFEYSGYSFSAALQAYNILPFLQRNTEIVFTSEIHTIKYSEGKLIYTPMLLNTINEIESLKTDFAANSKKLRALCNEIDEKFQFIRYMIADVPPVTDHDLLFTDALATNLTEEKLAAIITALKKTEADLSTHAALYIPSKRDDINITGHRSFVIEEPELNLSPSAQYELMKKLASARNKMFGVSYGSIHTYTTQSPYILLALNNLLCADNVIFTWQVMHKQSGNISYEQLDSTEKTVLQIVPSPINQYFMPAYRIADGRAESILNRSEGLIRHGDTGEVSGALAEDFEVLFNMEKQGQEF
ncbi:hypothetical protein F0L74_08605 [Chitinophaga agrisoli]|uniref:Uncharacterized protein n=1 Tax=Chitinophaga agrisoli TaxID=2607653 RepID=A0A5B2VWL5_9BACT|nr:hypothetical protein [Chitinophaga agrisoli]KAA2242586.1 hypothetical protein F0L74_08605 [Chitinophaga agrisoli]